MTITTNVVSLNLAQVRCTRYKVYVIKFVSDLRKVVGVPRVFLYQLSSTTEGHDITEILLKVALNTINQPLCTNELFIGVWSTKRSNVFCILEFLKVSHSVFFYLNLKKKFKKASNVFQWFESLVRKWPLFYMLL